MGDPKKIRKKYTKPQHPWQRIRIEEEKPLVKEFGVKNKKEIWKMEALLRSFMGQAKKLVIATTAQDLIEKQNLVKKLQRYGFLGADARIDQILGITLRDIMNKRLQTLVYKKGLAQTIQQARQMITHKHIVVAGRKVSSPSYVVPVEEEATILFAPRSPFAQQTAKPLEKRGQQPAAQAPAETTA